MNLDLDVEQCAQLELISVHIGKPPAQVLMDAATYLLRRDAQFAQLSEYPARSGTQSFLTDTQLEARFARMLGR